MIHLLTLHQALFGYRDGHNLLASSLSLSKADLRLLTTATDASGPDLAPGFEETITGFNLQDGKYYVLFCTWPAFEMRRPGCVWSHALFIPRDAFIDVSDLSCLRFAFRRPSTTDYFEFFENQIDVNVHRTLDTELDYSKAVTLIESLYTHPSTDVVVLAESGKVWEDIVFAVWSQQWPLLRQQFNFSTGSLANRSNPQIRFDLQIAPEKTRRLWRKPDRDTTVVEENEFKPKFASTPDWLRLAASDAVKPHQSGLRAFFLRFGKDLNRPREGFKKLATIYKLFDEVDKPQPIPLLLDAIRLFPSPVEAIELKKQLTNFDLTGESERVIDEHLQPVFEIFLSNMTSTFDSLELDITPVTSLLWNHAPAQLIELVVRTLSRDSKFGDVFIRAFAKVINANDLHVITRNHSQVLAPSIKYNPSIATEDETWRLPTELRWQVFRILMDFDLTDGIWRKIVRAMMSARVDDCDMVTTAVNRAGPYAIRAAFSWVSSNRHAELPPPAWRYALGSQAISKLAQVSKREPNPNHLAFIAWCLTAPNIDDISAPVEFVEPVNSNLRNLARNLRNIPSSLKIVSAFFLLGLGLKSQSIAGTSWVLNSFFLVNEAIALNNTESIDELWDALVRLSGGRLGYRNWDRCRELRRGVVDFLRKNEQLHRISHFAFTDDELDLAMRMQQSRFDDDQVNFID